MITHEIKCKFCNKVNGTIQIQEKFIPKDIKVDDKFCGIADSRCDDCEKKHGTFADEQAKKLIK